MITALLLIPDSLENPCGGMGVQLRGILDGALAAKLPMHFLIVGSDGERLDGENFVYIPHTIEPVIDSPQGMNVATFTGFMQATYLDAACWLVDRFGKPDVIHVFDWTAAYAGIILGRRLSVPIVTTFQLSFTTMVMTTHTPVINREDEAILNLCLAVETAVIHASQVVIQVSESYRHFWASVMPDQAEKMVVIGNATEPCPKNASPYQVTDGRFPVGYLGRCSVQKSADAIIRAVRSDEWPEDARLYWAGGPQAGEPHLWQALEQTAQQFSERLTLVGYVSGAEKWGFLKSMSAILFPSRHEPFGIVGLEAMAAGTPLVTTAVGGIAGYANETNSIRISPTAAGILEGIERAKGMDVGERERLVENGRLEAGKHQWSALARKLFEVYSGVVDEDMGKRPFSGLQPGAASHRPEAAESTER